MGKGIDRNLPSGVRDPMDFRGVEKELARHRKITPVEAPEIVRPPITVNMLAGFAWAFLRRHYDRPVSHIYPDGQEGWSPFHVDMWGLVCDPAPYVAIAAPRGHAKSTAITFAYGLANLLFRCESYIIIVSDTFEGQAVEHVRDYQRELKENDELIKAFHIKKFIKDVEGDLIIQFEDGNMGRVKALGMEGAIRGLKWRGKRPGMFIIDDAENPELVDSKLRRDKSRNWLMKDLIPAGNKGCKVRMVGTILHHDATLARFCRSSSWTSRIYKAHASFNDFSAILWPEMWPEERLRAERQRFINENDSDGYSQEYLNDPISPTDAYFKTEDLMGIPDEELTTPGDYYIGWDFAVTRLERNDFSVGTVWKVDDKRRKQIVDVVRGRWDSKEIIDKMIEMELLYNPRCHFSEKGTIDHALGPFLDTEMLAREVYMDVVKITRNKDKETFAKPLQGMVRKHDITFNKKMALWPDMEEELRRFLKGGHDDMVDALSVVAQGLRDITPALSRDERDDEDYFNRFREPTSPFSLAQGRNPTTGW